MKAPHNKPLVLTRTAAALGIMRMAPILVALLLAGGCVSAAQAIDSKRLSDLSIELAAEVNAPKLKYTITLRPSGEMEFRYEYLDDASGFTGIVSGNGFLDEVALRAIQAKLTTEAFFDLPPSLSYGPIEQGSGNYELRVQSGDRKHEVRVTSGGERSEGEWLRFFLVWEKLIDVCPAQPRMPVEASAARSVPVPNTRPEVVRQRD